MCAGATTGRLGSQSVGSFVSTFFPECNGQESSISDCTKTRECSSTNSEMGKLVVTCVMDSDLGVADSGTLCNMSSTSAPPATTESELPVTTSVASPPPNATDDMYTNTDSLSSSTKVDASGSNEQVSIGAIAIVLGGVVGGVIVVLVLIIGIIAAVICRRSNHKKQNIDVSALYTELMKVPIEQNQREGPVYETIMMISKDTAKVPATDTCLMDLKENMAYEISPVDLEDSVAYDVNLWENIAYETGKKITTQTNEAYGVFTSNMQNIVD